MEARAPRESSLVWDNHGCLPLRPLDEAFLPQLELYRSSGVGRVTIKFRLGGLCRRI